jgi:ribosomal protein L7Ae-like RNA K-turn-binding protein
MITRINKEKFTRAVQEGLSTGTIHVKKGVNEVLKQIKRGVEGLLLIANDLFPDVIEEILVHERKDKYPIIKDFSKYDLPLLIQNKKLLKASSLFLFMREDIKQFLTKVK